MYFAVIFLTCELIEFLIVCLFHHHLGTSYTRPLVRFYSINFKKPTFFLLVFRTTFSVNKTKNTSFDLEISSVTQKPSTPPDTFPSCVSVVLTLVATGAIEGPVTVGLAPSSAWALQVIPAERGVRGSAVLAGVRVFLREEGRVGPQLVPLEGQERLARLGDGRRGEECGEAGGGESREAALLERGGGVKRGEKNRTKRD